LSWEHATLTLEKCLERSSYQNTTAQQSNEESDFEKGCHHPFCIIRISYIPKELEDRR
jgi:hypothetical protein